MAKMTTAKRKEAAASQAACLLLSSTSLLLARGLLVSPPDAPNIQVKITSGRVEDVVNMEVVQVVSADDNIPVRLGRVILHRGALVSLEPLRSLGAEVRQNLRMPVDFESFAYPRTGGRVPVRSVDLSCGGIAFYAAYKFQAGEEFEIVIPITEPNPLILRTKILRAKPYMGPIQMYAAQFVDMLPDEEKYVREAVFSVQLQKR